MIVIITLRAVFFKMEEITCDVCGTLFVGRRAGEGGKNLCSSCLEDITLPVIDINKVPPNEVYEEFRRED